MAAGTKKAASVSDRPEFEKIVNFEPLRLRAPFLLRCAAVAIDYMLLIVFPVIWLLTSEILSESASGVTVGTISWYLGILVTIANLVVAPLWRGQTVGKMITGLTILKKDGTHPDIRSILMRNVIGYGITVLTFGLGFLVAAVNNSGRALHDFLGGTVVIRGRRPRLS